QDLVRVNGDTNRGGVLLGNGDGTFRFPPPSPGGSPAPGPAAPPPAPPSRVPSDPPGGRLTDRTAGAGPTDGALPGVAPGRGRGPGVRASGQESAGECLGRPVRRPDGGGTGDRLTTAPAGDARVALLCGARSNKVGQGRQFFLASPPRARETGGRRAGRPART